ncbi:threonine/serine dehydratase [Granulicella cerasi]|uniref:Threonine/serine dehydratase n=1 Tax=Granulicella cerasi TaxID=741063 RepID=A0ABW1ZEY2_9BACT|nr:threonine/serine dehydratase [Granulicella cerasi]
MSFVTLQEIEGAQRRIHGVAVETPLVRFNERIWLKDESKQPIGSFKLRGAYNMIAQLTPEQLRRGVITYSSGNHAQGVAYAARALGSKAVIVMPDNAPQVKVEATRALGAEVVFVGTASAARKLKAEELSAEHGYTVVPPYDDERIIAGQATCGVEIVNALTAEEAAKTLLLSPVSGGGLLSGVSTGVKLASEARGWTAPQVWGCEPELAGDAAESFRTKSLVEWPAEKTTRTLADGLRTQSLGAKNFEHILRFTDGIVTITEEELREALRLLLTTTDIVAEPSGAVTLAAALFHTEELPPAERLIAIVSGGNIDPKLRAEMTA